MSTLIYRVLQRGPTDFIIQAKRFWNWYTPDDFMKSRAGPGGHRLKFAVTYGTMVEAVSAIRKAEIMATRHVGYPKVVAQGMVANDGSWVPLRDE